MLLLLTLPTFEGVNQVWMFVAWPCMASDAHGSGGVRLRGAPHNRWTIERTHARNDRPDA